MKRMHYPLAAMLLLLGALLTATLCSCSGAGRGDAAGISAESDSKQVLDEGTGSVDLGKDRRTTQPAQVAALPGTGYSVEALLTVGDRIPLLTGSYPQGSRHNRSNYALPGICDGLGVHKSGGHYWVWLNHEIAAGVLSSYSDNVSGKISGARVSLIKFDDKWRVVAGRNLIERIYDSSGLIGEVSLNADATAVSQSGSVLNRLCSSTLTTLYGADPLFLTGEESSNGRPFAVETDGDAYVIDDLPLFAYENIVPISKWANETVIVALDDTADRYLVLYVGARSSADPYGLKSGTSYVARVSLDGVFQGSSANLLQGDENEVEWLEIPRQDAAGKDLYNNTSNFYAWANGKATRFMRPEDGSEDPAVPGDLHWVTTGRIGSYDEYGRVWKLRFGSTATATASLELTSVGRPDYHMNADNVTADSRGSFWVQEDPSGTQGIMLGAGRRASIWRSSIGTDSYVRLFEVLQDTAPFIPPLTQSFAVNPWETSGIVEVPGAPGQQATVLFDTQAHGWPSADYVEGGQLLLGYPSDSRALGGGNGNGPHTGDSNS